MSAPTGIAPPARPNVRPEVDLARWCIDPRHSLPSAAVLRSHNLAACAYAAAAPGAAGRAELRGDYLPALARHHRIRRELIPLVRAWNAVGIEPLIFKGFQLAEFVYPAPGMRFHGDVDVLVAPDRVDTAARVAREHGWRQTHDTAAAGFPHAHNACTLTLPGGACAIDLHRWALHCPLPWNRAQRRITRELWRDSRALVWEGARIRVPSPVDAIVVGVILQRAWSGDRWCLKPHDPLDLRTIVQRFEVSPEEILQRGRELRASRTVAIMLGRCDGSRPVSFAVPPRGTRMRWDLAAIPERGPLSPAQLLLGRLLRIPSVAPHLASALRAWRAARRALRRGDALAEMLRSLSPPARRHATTRPPPPGLIRATVWVCRAFPYNRDGDCLLRALALHHALSTAGWSPTFVSGVRRAGGRLVGHAWVEIAGEEVDVGLGTDSRQAYAVNFQYSSAPEPGGTPRTPPRTGIRHSHPPVGAHHPRGGGA